MKHNRIVVTVIALLIVLVLVEGLVASGGMTARERWDDDQKWYWYCEEPYRRAMHGHGHTPPPHSGEPCVPIVPGEPPPI